MFQQSGWNTLHRDNPYRMFFRIERPGPNTRCLTLNSYGAIGKAEILESARLREAEAHERLRELEMIFSI